MQEYKSIETLFVRDPISHALDLKQIRVEAAQVIQAWSVTEKLDGMNIRAIFSLTVGSLPTLTVKGRTDNAQLPRGVAEAVERAFSAEGREFIAKLWYKELGSGKTVTFYGEAIGEGIQSNPLRLAGKRFRVFDILVGENVWLDDATIQSLAEDDAIGYAAVPHYGLLQRLPKDEADLQTITRGGISILATERVRPEGIVARPLIPLFDTYGNRVIWKLTFREFDKLDQIARSATARPAVSMPEPVL